MFGYVQPHTAWAAAIYLASEFANGRDRNLDGRCGSVVVAEPGHWAGLTERFGGWGLSHLAFIARHNTSGSGRPRIFLGF